MTAIRARGWSERVAAFQATANAAGYEPPLVVDGLRGPRTRAAELWMRARESASRWSDAVLGIDVSAHQKLPDADRVRSAGYRWAIVKVSEGTGYTQNLAPEQVKRFRASGMAIAGGYHFPGRKLFKLGPRVTAAPEKEAAHFLRCAEKAHSLPAGAFPILDIEGADYRFTHERKVRWWVEWIHIVESETGRPVLRYSLAAYLWAHARDASIELRRELADGPLWWAEYGTHAAPRKDPTPWDPENIRIWQFEGRQGKAASQVPGVSVTCDVNRMLASEWRSLATVQGVPL